MKLLPCDRMDLHQSKLDAGAEIGRHKIMGLTNRLVCDTN